MATYDPQKGHARPKPTADEPAPVDELLDVAAEPAPEPEQAPESEPAAAPSGPSPVSVADASPAPAQVGGTARRLPAKKVGAGVALTALVFALSWAFRRRRRAGRS
ncbi:MAG: hypothetical protein JNK12_00620 [Acidimicrobiales bacterium]|nr:hypothetical protein [Acidimicrobiales bacterium]